MTILNWLQQAVQFLVLIPSAMLCYLLLFSVGYRLT